MRPTPSDAGNARKETTAPPVIEGVRDLFSHYDVLVSDIWGVMHDGRRAYAPAGEAFARFRVTGGSVVLLSNAPMPSGWVERVLDEKGVRRDAWDAIVSSGDISLRRVADGGFRRVFHIGPDRDLPLFETMRAQRAPFAAAEAIVCTGLVDDRNETAEDYRSLLEQALSRRLLFVCANPDLVVDVGGELLPCAGVIAELYEAMGGEVYWSGKPHAPAYEMAMAVAADLRGGPISRRRVLAIGDAVRTDIAGAAAFGLDSLFIAQGIHRNVVVRDGGLDPDALARLFAGQPAGPVAAMIGVTW